MIQKSLSGAEKEKAAGHGFTLHGGKRKAQLHELGTQWRGRHPKTGEWGGPFTTMMLFAVGSRGKQTLGVLRRQPGRK